MKDNLLKCCFAGLLAIFCLLAPASLSALEEDFNYDGTVRATLKEQAFLLKDDLALRKGGKDIDNIDWRAHGAPSPLDKRVTRRGANGILTSVCDVQRIDKGVQVIWDCSISGAADDAKMIEVTLTVPANILAFLPRKLGSVPARFDTEKDGVVESDITRYTFNLKGSNVKIKSGILVDFRDADWKKAFHLSISTEEFTGNSVKIVLNVTADDSQKLYSAGVDSPFLSIPVAEYGNRTYDDQVENDGKGGWSDQGANDMSMLKPGTLVAQGIPFAIGKKAIILKGKMRQGFPEKSPEIPVNAKLERLAFCHTGVWSGHEPKAYFYQINYADGTTAEIPVAGDLDVVDWAQEVPVSARSRCAFKSVNNEHLVTLCHMQWKNPKPDVAIRSLQVCTLPDQWPIPVVAAITGVQKEKMTPELQEFLDRKFQENPQVADPLPEKKENWFECMLPVHRNIKPGSALDVSFLRHAPAGKFGFMKRVGDHFEFEKKPGERVTFWGTCVVPSPRKEDAVAQAEALSRAGVNIVRMGLCDSLSFRPNSLPAISWILRRGDGSIDPVVLDRWQFFCAELTKRGIYIYMNFHETEDVSYIDSSVNEEARQKRVEFGRLLFRTVNPYTGKCLADDPAFSMCEIHNEQSIAYGGDIANRVPADREYLNQRWTQWQKERGISPLTQLKGNPMEGNGEEGRRFYSALEKEYLEKMYRDLREMGVKIPICGTNLELTAGDLWSSQNMDYMNDHTYYGAAPYGLGFWQPTTSSAVKAPLSGVHFFGEIIHSRLADKPIVCTEWSFVYPNIYRAEGYPFAAALSAFQGIDGMFSFEWGGAYTGNLMPGLKDARILCLTQICDPSTWGLNQAAAVAYLRGDVAMSKKRVDLQYTEADIWGNRRQIPLTVSFLFQMARVGIVLPQPDSRNVWPLGTGSNSQQLYEESIKKLGIEAGPDYVKSDTREIIRFADPALMLVDTAKSQFALGALSSMGEGTNRKLSAFSIGSSAQFATLTFTSLDGLPLLESKRILLTAVGNSANAKAAITSKGYAEPCQGPVLTEPITAKIGTRGMPFNHVYALQPATGERIAELTLSKDGKTFDLATAASKTIYFELTRP